MRPSQTRPDSPRITRPARRRGPFSDAIALGIILTAAITALGCAQQPQIAPPGSPLREARIDVVLPPAGSASDARLHFERPEYARRDWELGLQR